MLDIRLAHISPEKQSAHRQKMVKVKKFWMEKYEYEISIIQKHKKFKETFKLKDLSVMVKRGKKCKADFLLKSPSQIDTI